jgi:hypothetical protein
MSWFVEVKEEGVLLGGEIEDVKDERDALYALQMNRADMTVQI